MLSEVEGGRGVGGGRGFKRVFRGWCPCETEGLQRDLKGKLEDDTLHNSPKEYESRYGVWNIIYPTR